MHYYSHNIADFNSETRHLTRVERSLYRDLTELYYDTEQPLDSVDRDKLNRKVLAQTDEERVALSYVLEEFFFDDGEKYNHIGCDIQIAKYHANSSAKAKAGKASADARRKKLKGNPDTNSTPVEHPLNICATNHKPITKEKSKPAAIEIPEWLDPGLLNDFIDSRKANKKPMTQKAISLLINKISKERDNGHDATQMLEDAIVGGWQSVYPKDKPKQSNDILINHSSFTPKQLKNQSITANVLDVNNTNW